VQFLTARGLSFFSLTRISVFFFVNVAPPTPLSSVLGAGLLLYVALAGNSKAFPARIVFFPFFFFFAMPVVYPLLFRVFLVEYISSP